MLKQSYSQMNDLLAGLNQFVNIRYAAYRTAAKLRYIQTNLKLDHIKLNHVLDIVEKFGLRPSERELRLTSDELRPIINDIYACAQKEILVQLNPKSSAQLVLDLLNATFNQ